MLQAIVGAIVSALRSLGGLARRVAAAPFQALANLFGGGLPVVPEVAAPVVDEDEPSHGPDMDAVYRDLAIAVRTWAANSIIEGQPEPLPPKFPRGLSEWLPGISLDEAHALINATEYVVSAHLRSRELIPGVSSIRPLAPAVWPEELLPHHDRSPPEEVSYDACYAPAR